MIKGEQGIPMTIKVNRDSFHEKERRKKPRKIEIDRIIIEETQEEQKRTPTKLQQADNDKDENAKKSPITDRMNGIEREDTNERTLKVGKLDVTKIEQKGEERQIMKNESRIYHKGKKVKLMQLPC